MALSGTKPTHVTNVQDFAAGVKFFRPVPQFLQELKVGFVLEFLSDHCYCHNRQKNYQALP